MTVSARSAAKWLAERSGWSLSNLELQKRLYLAHMIHLARTSEPLIQEGFEAWDYGPVVPELYHEAKVYGAQPVGNIFPSRFRISANSDEARSLDEAFNLTKGFSPGRLVAVTHWPEGAWAKHYRSDARGTPIPDEDIKEEFNDRVSNAKRKRANQ